MSNEPVAYINEVDGLVCAKCYKPFKELTDEEKKQITKEYLHRHLLYVVTEEVIDDHKLHDVVVSDFDFAREILNKAREQNAT